MSARELTDAEFAVACLPQLAARRCDDYADWLAVGMALHAAGAPCAAWEAWSRGSAKYREGVCAAKWQGFNGDAGGVGVGSLVQWLREDGGTLPPRRAHQAMGWDSEIGGGAETATCTPAVPPPGATPAQDLARYLAALYRPEERVSYVLTAFEDGDGVLKPGGRGVYTRTAGDLQAALTKHGDLSFALGDWHAKAGAWGRLNPMDGAGVGNDNVVDCRHVLVESDALPVDQQLALVRELRLPCAAIVHSGGKSIHAVVKVEAGSDRKLYRERVEYLFGVLEKHGFLVDRQCKNPSRLSRWPGFTRGEKMQYLIGVNEGCQTWREWEVAQQDEGFRYREISVGDLEQADPAAQADSLLGQRFLCREGSWLIVGQSGIGKSSFMLQCAACFAIGRAAFGILPAGALRQVIIQAENSFLDLAEPYQGIVSALAFTGEDRALASRNLTIICEDTCTGSAFAKLLDHVAKKYEPQVVWIDPLLAYIGGEIGRQEVCSGFLRNAVNPVLHARGIAVVFLHHTPKPRAKDDKLAGQDQVYLGTGSSDLANWARAITTITAAPDAPGVFEVAHPKRGKRLAAPVRFVEHAAAGICWCESAPPGVRADSPARGPKSRYHGVGLEYLKPVKHTAVHAESELLREIGRIYQERGEPLTLEQAETVRKSVAKLADPPFFYDRKAEVYRGKLAL